MLMLNLLLFLLGLVFLLAEKHSLISIKFDRGELNYYDKTYFKNVKWETYLINRTIRAVRGQFSLKKNFNLHTKMNVSVQKFVSNEYRLGAIQFSETLHNLMKGKLSLFDSGVITANYCSPNISWPIRVKVVYKCKDIYPDLKFFPPFLSGQWKYHSKLLNENGKLLADFAIYTTIENVFEY